MDLTVERVDRTAIALPYRERVADHMRRTLPDRRFFEVDEVVLADGTSGIGEMRIPTGWSETSEAAIDRVVGTSATRSMWDASIGAGLQMALLDAVGTATDVPAASVIGERQHEAVPISWWAIDMPAADWIAECETAIDRGYTGIKVKGRPWWDIRSVLAEVSEAVPDWFEIDIDFNTKLLDADRAIDVLDDLSRQPQVRMFETPIPQTDIEGNRRLREELPTALALHYGRPDPRSALTHQICDGFVLNAEPATRLREQAAVAAMADKPFWLQLTGTAVTATFTVHLAATLSHATWPAITCHQYFADQVVSSPLDVSEGTVAVPQEPGLGVELDREALATYRVDRDEIEPFPDRLIEVSWPDGRRMYFANYQEQMRRYGREGKLPYFAEGASTRLVPPDERDDWQALQQRAASEPVVVDAGEPL